MTVTKLWAKGLLLETNGIFKQLRCGNRKLNWGKAKSMAKRYVHKTEPDKTTWQVLSQMGKPENEVSVLDCLLKETTRFSQLTFGEPLDALCMNAMVHAFSDIEEEKRQQLLLENSAYIHAFVEEMRLNPELFWFSVSPKDVIRQFERMLDAVRKTVQEIRMSWIVKIRLQAVYLNKCGEELTRIRQSLPGDDSLMERKQSETQCGKSASDILDAYAQFFIELGALVAICKSILYRTIYLTYFDFSQSIS